MADNATSQESLYGDYEDYPDFDDNSGLRDSMHLLSMVLYSVAFLLGVIGNGLVIFVTGFRMKRTVNTVWFLNLALADFVFTFFLPLSVAYMALGFHWPFGKALCKLNTTVAFLNMFASVFLLTVISMDRCVSVACPVWAQNYRTPRLASMVALGIWLAAMALSSPYFFFRDTRSSTGEENTTHCYNNFALSDDLDSEEVAKLGEDRHRAMVMTRFVVGFLVPFTIILFCYGIITARLKGSRLTRSGRPFKIMVAVVLAFFICWFPYHVFSFLEMSVTTVTPWLQTILVVGVPLASGLAYVNSCLNPFLYVFVGHDFREKLRTSVLAAFQNAFSETSAQRILLVLEAAAAQKIFLLFKRILLVLEAAAAQKIFLLFKAQGCSNQHSEGRGQAES
uniref:G-protein coupled receptors family 1 profile domain-containing protein n=1 Tax=Podarcis muralis TaxID=64176 RepID=A0A670IGS3_PODMU